MSDSELARPNCASAVFLDVDGVLNRVGTKEQSPHGTCGVEPGKAAMVRKILEETDAQIVVSSTWRRYRDLLHYLWQQIGCDLKDRWAGNTPILDGRTPGGIYTAPVRGDEIQAWLDKNPDVTRFVILDDDGDMKHLMPHLLLCHGNEGLTEAITEIAIRRLNAEVSDGGATKGQKP